MSEETRESGPSGMAGDNSARFIADRSSDAVAVTDEEGTVVAWNERFAEMTGLSAADAIGRPLWDVQYELEPQSQQISGYLDELTLTIQGFLRTGIGPESSGPFTRKFQHPDGSAHHLEATLFSFKTDQGYRLASITRDVTDIVQTGRALEAYSAQQTAQLEIGRVAISATSRDQLIGEAADKVSIALNVDLCGILELQQDGDTLLLAAGSGWESGRIGSMTVSAGKVADAGYSLLSAAPTVISEQNDAADPANIAGFSGLGMRSGVAVVIGDVDEVIGVLAVLTAAEREFTDDEIAFVQSVALTVAEAWHRLRTSERLLESEALFRTMFQSASVGISRVSLDYVIRDANKRLCDMLGYDRSQLIGMTIWDVTGPESLAQNKANQAKLREGEIESFQMEKEYVRSDGTLFWGLLDTNIVKDETGEPLYFLGNVVDISERKRAEADLRKLSAGVAQSPVAIVITDRNGDIEYANPAFVRVTGYSADEAIGQSPRILKSGEQPAELYRDLWKTILSGGTWNGEFHNRRKDGVLYWEEATIGPITDSGGEITHFIAFKEDITERKDLEMRLLQSQRLEAIGQLAGGIAHDFNNLLTVINGYSAIVLAELSDDDPRRLEIQKINAAGERAGTLTQQLLAFSRKQVIQPAVVDLNEVVNEVTALLRRLVGEDIELHTSLDPDLVRTRVDAGQMNQVIMNLAVNARDALPSGGRITIETANFRIDRDYSASHMEARPGHYCMVAVSDDGVGMDTGTCSHAFEPFFTTKGVGQGTGLGLSTVYGIVKQHSGYVWLYSEPGHGTTAKVYLPAADQDDAMSTGQPPDLDVVTGNERILLVEDDDTVRALSAGILERAGYEVHQAADGHRARMLFGKVDDHFDLLVTDVIMPGMGGKELADELTAGSPDLRVLFVSGYTDEAISRTGILREDVEFISKPFHPEDLLARVRLILDNG